MIEGKKILIVGFFPRTNMPYVQEYENLLKEKNISYDLICFDRTESKKVSRNANVITYYCKLGTNKFQKLIPYLLFIKMVKKFIKRNKYSKIIVLTTVPAVLLRKTLVKKYPGKYIFDYRDYSFEKYNFYKKAVNEVSAKSFATVLSSGGFFKFVNKTNKTFLVHNISNTEFEVENPKKIGKPIKIGFVGLVRYFDVNTKLIKAFENNPNYSLVYHGSIYDDCDLPSYCKENSINNVTFTGPYENDQKPQLYENIDVINSIYSLESPEVSQAIPNRLYDAALYKKPLLVAKNCYLADVVDKYGLGKSIDTSLSAEEFYSEVTNFIENFDQDKFLENCKFFLTKVNLDQNKFRNVIRDFLFDNK